MTHHLEQGKREFLCPFAWIKASPWDKRDQPLAEDLIKLQHHLGLRKLEKESQTKHPILKDPNPTHARDESG